MGATLMSPLLNINVAPPNTATVLADGENIQINANLTYPTLSSDKVLVLIARKNSHGA